MRQGVAKAKPVGMDTGKCFWGSDICVDEGSVDIDDSSASGRRLFHYPAHKEAAPLAHLE